MLFTGFYTHHHHLHTPVSGNLAYYESPTNALTPVFLPSFILNTPSQKMFACITEESIQFKWFMRIYRYLATTKRVPARIWWKSLQTVPCGEAALVTCFLYMKNTLQYWQSFSAFINVQLWQNDASTIMLLSKDRKKEPQSDLTDSFLVSCRFLADRDIQGDRSLKRHFLYSWNHGLKQWF